MSQWQIEQIFANLPGDGYAITSPETEGYNCFAWAAGQTGLRIDPYDQPDGYWPANLPRDASLATFIALFQTLGFQPCANGELQRGIAKIAIYVAPTGEATHAARQLDDGRWTSKLGDLEDVCHNSLGSLSTVYGTVATYVARPIEKG